MSLRSFLKQLEALKILDGKHDDIPEQAFLYVGSIDDVVKKAKTL